jgi:hypothetical protein
VARSNNGMHLTPPKRASYESFVEARVMLSVRPLLFNVTLPVLSQLQLTCCDTYVLFPFESLDYFRREQLCLGNVSQSCSLFC